MSTVVEVDFPGNISLKVQSKTIKSKTIFVLANVAAWRSAV